MRGVPDRLGGFTLLSELGRGGMGVVYLARQDALDRLVAIKLLAAEATDHAARLRHEAQVLSELQNPYVVSVIDVGEFEGRPYLVMPYLGGGSLADVLRRDGHLTPGQTAGVLAAVAEALAAAHSRGILHRDVKPNNILFSASGDPYLSDFGIATGSSATRTTTGELLGTVGYFAPETIAGSSASAASDVYGLGVVGYVALAGRMPFQAENLVAALDAARSGQFDPLGDVAPDAPPKLVGLITSCLAFDAAARPADLRALADELRDSARPARVVPLAAAAAAVAATEGVTQLGKRGRQVTVPEAAPPPARRSRWLAVGAVAVGVAAIAGIATAVALNHGGSHATLDLASGSASPTAGAASSPVPSSPVPSSPAASLAASSAVTSASAAISSAAASPAPVPTQAASKPTAKPAPKPAPKPTVKASSTPTKTTPTAAAVVVPLTLTAIPAQATDEMAAVHVQLAGHGPTGATISYAQVSGTLPAGVSLDATTGAITGTISASAANVTTTYTAIGSASFSASFIATSGGKQSPPQTLTWTVRDTYIAMPNYVGKYGCGATCGESQPELGKLLSPANHNFKCYIGTPTEDKQWQSSEVYAQTPAPGTPLPWGGAPSDSITFYYPSTTASCPT